MKDWSDESQVDKFKQQAINLVKRATGAESAYVFDHTFRKADQDSSTSLHNVSTRGPAQGVHVDYSKFVTECCNVLLSKGYTL